tara:strand:- start:841 stop:1638 length:798 start_codon:yes stop_codon:yes gene_type:complete
MPPRIVIKLGGGLITDKGKMKTFDEGRMENLAKAISNVADLGFAIVLVHGAGSFGHLIAKKWDIAGGLESSISEEQGKAVNMIRSDMRELSNLVASKLEMEGLYSESFPPSQWAEGTGIEFKGELGMFERSVDQPIPITFGDVVETGNEKQFGILSGDDLMLRISKDLPSVTHSIFLIGDAAGVMSAPPGEEGAELIEQWSSKSQAKAKHDEEIDVTGGISLKIERATMISECVDNVWIIDGRKPERILELIEHGETRGTRIVYG